MVLQYVYTHVIASSPGRGHILIGRCTLENNRRSNTCYKILHLLIWSGTSLLLIANLFLIISID